MINTINTKAEYKAASISDQQRAVDAFVNNHVLAIASNIVEFILSTDPENAPFSYDDFVNMHEVAEIDGVLYTREEIELLEEEELTEEAEFYYPQVLEYWLVTKWFLSKLEEKGEVTLAGYCWGRTCSGQSIALDCVIVEIFMDTLAE